MHSRNNSLADINKRVLKLIQRKKQPLNTLRYQRLNKKQQNYMSCKLKTMPSEIIQEKPVDSLNRKSSFQDQQRSMADHFYSIETRELMFKTLQSDFFEELAEKVNRFVSKKRKELYRQSCQNSKENMGFEIETPKINLLKKKSSKDHQFQQKSNMRHTTEDETNDSKKQKRTPKLLSKKAHIKMFPVLSSFRKTQSYQTAPSVISQNRQHIFFESASPRFTKEQIYERMNNQIRQQMINQIRKCSLEDKYTRMRIPINHRKIINLQ